MADPFSTALGLFGGASSALGGGVSDLFAAQGDLAKAKGDLAEAGEYGIAAGYADKEAEYTKISTAISAFQQERELSKSLGQTSADVAGAGFAASGSSFDLLRESASQGALAMAVTGQQGLIQVEGFEEQAESYRMMQSAELQAAGAAKQASLGADIGAGIQGLTAGLKVAQALALL